jgi:hypothetical protein
MLTVLNGASFEAENLRPLFADANLRFPHDALLIGGQTCHPAGRGAPWNGSAI